IPTIAESGLAGYEAYGWYGIAAPARTPSAVIARLHAEVAKIAHNPVMKARLGAQGLELVGNTPAEFDAFIRSEIATWRAVLKTTKFGKSGLNAARLVQLLGYGGALAVLWLIAQRAAALLPSGDERWNVLKSILVPLATLIVVASGQAVLLLVLAPLMNKAWQQ